MTSKYLKILVAILLFGAVCVVLNTTDILLQSASLTYREIVEEIDERDIDTGNAMNVFGDEASGDAVYEATQTMEHPPGKGIHQ